MNLSYKIGFYSVGVAFIFIIILVGVALLPIDNTIDITQSHPNYKISIKDFYAKNDSIYVKLNPIPNSSKDAKEINIDNLNSNLYDTLLSHVKKDVVVFLSVEGKIPNDYILKFTKGNNKFKSKDVFF